MSAVVDQYGYLWTGSGPFLYNSVDPTSYSVLRFDTSNIATAILAVQLPDEANVSYRSMMHIAVIYKLQAMPSRSTMQCPT